MESMRTGVENDVLGNTEIQQDLPKESGYQPELRRIGSLDSLLPQKIEVPRLERVRSGIASLKEKVGNFGSNVQQRFGEKVATVRENIAEAQYNARFTIEDYKLQVQEGFENLKSRNRRAAVGVAVLGALTLGGVGAYLGADAVLSNGTAEASVPKYVPTRTIESTAVAALATALPEVKPTLAPVETKKAEPTPEVAIVQPTAKPEAEAGGTPDGKTNPETVEEETEEDSINSPERKEQFYNEWYSDAYKVRSEANGDVEVFRREVNGQVVYYTIADVGPDSSVEPEIINSDNAEPVMTPDGRVAWSDGRSHNREQDAVITEFEERTGQRVFAATNGSFAGGNDSSPLGSTVNNGEINDNTPVSSWTNSLVVTENGDIEIGIFSRDKLKEMGAETVIGVAPPVIRDGQVVPFEYIPEDGKEHHNPDKAIMTTKDAKEAENQLTNGRAKTWIGKRRDGKLVLLTSKHVQGNNLANIMVTAGIVDMAPLDGGQSSNMFVHKVAGLPGNEIEELTGNRHDEDHTLRDIPNSFGLVSKK